MRLLLIHADHFEYEVKNKAIKEPEEINESRKRGSADNALVAFCTVEKDDENDPNQIVSKSADSIQEVAKQVKAKNIVIYPYAHLSSNLGAPRAAIPILEELDGELGERGFNVKRSPFGWYKSFDISCKGHPLAELSRTIVAEKTVSKAITPAAKTIPKILTADLKLHDPANFNYGPKDAEFKAMVEKEALHKDLIGGHEPKYLKYCKKFGIQWESYSDVGHMRYSPEGTLLFELISDYARKVVYELGIPVFPVRGTNLFDLSVPAVKEHAELYGGRLYEVKIDDKSYVLRYAACHQQFAMVKDWILSYKDLPMAAFEIADSYRLEQEGELLLSFRVRKLHMPDLHVFCKNLDEAMNFSVKIHEKIYGEIKKIDRDYVSLYNTTERYFKEHPDYFRQLMTVEKKPVLVNFVPEKFYWVINIEYNIVDELKRPREIGTFQIDIGNAKRFGITYTNEKGVKEYPMIIHTAIVGSIERFLFAVFDTVTRMEEKGIAPMFPVWLSPTQIRIVPVSKGQFDYAMQVADDIESSGLRVDIDDSDETLSKKIRKAETAWVPYVAVVGEKEKESGKLSVRIRKIGENTTMSIAELKESVKEAVQGYPYRSLPMPRLLSRRPIYQ